MQVIAQVITQGASPTNRAGDDRLQTSEYGAGSPVLLLALANSPAEFESVAAQIGQAGFHVMLLRKQAKTSVPTLSESLENSSAVLLRFTAPAVIIAGNSDAEVARQLALRYPEHVRGLVLASESAAAVRANEVIPAAATLYIQGKRKPDRLAVERAQMEWGSRLSLIEIADAGAMPLSEQPQRSGEAVVKWLQGPALSSLDAKARIALPDDASLSAQQQALRKQMLESLNSPAGSRVGAVGPRAVLLHDPKLVQGYTAMGDVMATAPVPLRYKELAILVTARAMDSDYEWAAHERAALNAGVPAAVVSAIKVGRVPVFDSAADRIVYNYADELHRNHKLSDTTYQQAWDLLGTNGLLNLTVVIGHYVNVAMTLNAHQLALPANAQPLPPRDASK
ncbi:MAG: carboxymuconolactone decarboxylase family protein [Steroidobacteraceae bacterium]